MKKYKLILFICCISVGITCYAESYSEAIARVAEKCDNKKDAHHLVLKGKLSDIEDKLRQTLAELFPMRKLSESVVKREAFHEGLLKSSKIRDLTKKRKEAKQELENYLVTKDDLLFYLNWSRKAKYYARLITTSKHNVIRKIFSVNMSELFMRHIAIEPFLKDMSHPELLEIKMDKIHQVWNITSESEQAFILSVKRKRMKPSSELLKSFEINIPNSLLKNEYADECSNFESRIKNYKAKELNDAESHNEILKAIDNCVKLKKVNNTLLKQYADLLYNIYETFYLVSKEEWGRRESTYSKILRSVKLQLKDDQTYIQLKKEFTETQRQLSKLLKNEYPFVLLGRWQKLIGTPSIQLQKTYEKWNSLKERNRNYLFSKNNDLKLEWKKEQLRLKQVRGLYEQKQAALKKLDEVREKAVKALSDNNEIATLKSEYKRLKKNIDDAYYSIIPKLKEVTSEEIRDIVKERNRNKVRKVDGYIKNSKAFYTARRELDKFLYDNNELFKNAQDEHDKFFRSKKEHTHGKKKVPSRKISNRKEKLKKRKKLLEKMIEEKRLKKLKEKEEK